MSVYSDKNNVRKMEIRATVQTKLACGALIIVIVNICFLIAVLAYISREESCEQLLTKTANTEMKVHVRKLQTNVSTKSWMLAFLILPENFFVGGAVIITENWAVTTAECVKSVSHYSITRKVFRGGSTNWNKNGFYHYVTRIISHEDFDPHTLACNIALVQVDRPFNNRNEGAVSIIKKKSNVCLKNFMHVRFFNPVLNKTI